MCITARISYNDCSCTLHRYYICHSHIKHTWHQKDNKPCPYTAVRHIVLDARACTDPYQQSFHEQYAPLGDILSAAATTQHGSQANNTRRPPGCLAIHADEYNVATKVLRRSDMRFLELGEGGYMSEDCLAGKFMWASEHTCGLGRRVACTWAHLRPDNRVLNPKAMKTLEELAVEEIVARSRREVQRNYFPVKASSKTMDTIQESAGEESDMETKQEKLRAMQDEMHFVQVEVERYLRFRKYMAAAQHEKAPSAAEILGMEIIYKFFEEKVGVHTALLTKKEAARTENEYRVKVKKLQVSPENVMNEDEAEFAAEYASQNGYSYNPDIKQEGLDMDITTLSVVNQ
ncbi:hypothetical protein HYALB_00008892 [Hymenoscyphus albidus]|uniref:Uncharacterized protein n=1 Tax=Hymenoscyphus albidus TaxID=595503 RepID=A0A9N9LRD1_9HELO|nr:hypothetical protein HYALB_00008892 [Hymenoscyphus albidus]